MIKCYECKNQNLTKTVQPCSECEHRPHDLCTSDKFEPAKEEPVGVDLFIARRRLQLDFQTYIPPNLRGMVEGLMVESFKAGEKNQSLRHRETISIKAAVLEFKESFDWDSGILAGFYKGWEACKKSHGL